MLLSILYHGWEGWGRGEGYPNNTFLFIPEDRYGDFTNTYRYALTGMPYRYSQGGVNYFPVTFPFFYLFAWLPPVPATILFLSLCTIGLFVLTEAALRPIVSHPAKRMLASILLIWTYPFLLVLDRGNTEILIILLVAGSLFFYSRKKFKLSFTCLVPAICFKVYPALLLLLFVRHRLFHLCFAAVAAFLAISWAALLTFPDTVFGSCRLLSEQLGTYTKVGILSPNGVAGSASAWNMCRIVTWVIYRHNHGGPEFVGQLPLETTSYLLTCYSIFALIVLIFLTLYILFIETSFARRAILLLLYMTVSSPGGGDYKIMLIGIALVALILIPGRRRGDLVAVVLMAICLLPKREILLRFMGWSDSGAFDASSGVIINPLCMLAAMGLLLYSGWQATPSLQFKRMFLKSTGLFRFAGLRTDWIRLQSIFQAKRVLATIQSAPKGVEKKRRRH